MTMRTTALVLALTVVLSGVAWGGASPIDPNDPARGYAVSVPPIAAAPNGDLVSNYPPYFRPNK